MNAKGLVFFTTVVATAVGLFGTPGKAAAVDSSITIDNIAVTLFGTGMNKTYNIVVTGTITLGTTDTYIGVSATMQNPNGASVTPLFISATAPAQGKSTTYTVTASNVAPITGNWSVVTQMLVGHNGGQLTVRAPGQTFTVP